MTEISLQRATRAAEWSSSSEKPGLLHFLTFPPLPPPPPPPQGLFCEIFDDVCRCFAQTKSVGQRKSEYNLYSTFQSHEPEFDYLKSLEIEEKINKIRWLRRKNPSHFLLSTNGTQCR